MRRTRHLTISQLLAAYPHVTESQLRYALRGRKTNGLEGAILKPRTGHAFVFNESRILAWLGARVPA